MVGRNMVGPLVDRLAALSPDMVIHSDMARTRAIAEPLAQRLGIASISAPLWRERDFGAWEGKSWHAIYRMTGNAMDGMIDDPCHFRPGGGETSAELVSRIVKATSALPAVRQVVVVTHGGPIAARRMIASGMDYAALPQYIIPLGSICSLDMSR